MKDILFVLTITVFFSCEQTIKLDLDQTTAQLVIEGLVTDHPPYNYVKLSKTAQFYDTGATPKISGAIVLIKDMNGATHSFTETEPGVYKPSENFAGTPGHTYELTVTVGGKTYTASQKMLKVPPMDSLTHQQVTDIGEEYEKEGRTYEMYLFMREPANEENYYLFKFYRNDEILDFDGQDVYAFDDTALSENIDGISTPEYYALGDTGKVELFSIDRKAFRYFTDLSNTLNNDGGLFSGIPANAISNLEGGAIGYFQVSAVDIKELIIE